MLESVLFNNILSFDDDVLEWANNQERVFPDVICKLQCIDVKWPSLSDDLNSATKTKQRLISLQ